MTALAFAALAAVVAAGEPQLPVIPQSCRDIRLHFENDVWSGTDESYTNGVRIEAGGCEAGLAWFQPVVARLEARGFKQVEPGWVAGHNLYTPDPINDPHLTPAQVYALQQDDRPYASWLYVGMFAHAFRGLVLHWAEVELGVTGRPAMGEEVQTRFHELVGSQRPLFWSRQTAASPVLQLRYFGQRQLASFPHVDPEARLVRPRWVDAFGDVEVRAGNLFNAVSATATVRAGRIASGFGPSRLNVGLTYAPEGRFWEVYGFARLTGRFVASNATIQGTPFRENVHTRRLERGVLDWEVGGEVGAGPLSFGLNWAWRSTEVASQEWDAFDHPFIQFSVHYVYGR